MRAHRRGRGRKRELTDVLLLHHDGQLLALAVKDRVEVQVDGLAPALEGQLVGHGRLAHGAGIVDGDVEAAKRGRGLGDGVLDGLGAGDVEDDGHDLDGGEALGEQGGGGVEAVLANVGDGEAGGAVAGKVEGRGLADAWMEEETG